MNLLKVLKYIGSMLILEAVLMLLPFLCSLYYKEHNGIFFLIIALPLLILGFILSKVYIKDKKFYSAEGFVTAALGWIVLSFFGALPFYFSGEIPNFINAIFETVSGFTTTGATILNDVTTLSKCMNFWRCLTHFVGGMGVLVLMIAIIPTQSENLQILKAESPGPQVGKLLPRVSDTAKTLYYIYVFLTIVAIICYKFSGMKWFDSICIGLGTAGTGGFVVTKNGCADYGTVSQCLITFFMILYGVNFNIYYLVLLKKFKDAIKSEELRIYLLIIMLSVSIITLNRIFVETGLLRIIHESFFHVASIITTTGFSTCDITEWPVLSQFVFLNLMVFGGCAGSTAGGFKIARVVMLFKFALNELYLQIHPNSVKIVKFEYKQIDNDTIRTINSYTIIYIIINIIAIMLISLENFDFTTTLASVFETFNNIGLGLSLVGPKGNFSIFNSFSKIVFIMLMLIGRLEIFPVLVLISRKTWRRES